MEKEELRNIPTKNYIILAVVLLVSLGLVYYFHLWYKAYNENKLNTSLVAKYMDNINYNELDNYLVENSNAIIYVSVLNNEEIKNFERDFKSLFRRKKIKANLLYMDITDDIDSFNYRYSNLGVPSVMIFNNGNMSIAYKINPSDYDLVKIRDFINTVVKESELDD